MIASTLPFPLYSLQYNIMKLNQQINHRSRLSNYYKYILQKVENDEPYNHFKLQHTDSPPRSPVKSQYRGSDSSTISHSDKKSNRYYSERQVSKIQLIETNTPKIVKLPPIVKHSSMLERQGSCNGVDWQKYYNVHKLATVNIDEGTIQLIQANHRRRKAKRSISINQQRNDV